MPKTLKFQNVLLCAYATRGAHGKFTLVDVFAGNEIRVSNVPGVVQLSLYAELIPDADTPHKISVRFTHNGAERIQLDFEMEPMQPGRTAVLCGGPLPYQFSEPGLLAVSATAEGFDSYTILQKTIVLDASLTASASPPPS